MYENVLSKYSENEVKLERNTAISGKMTKTEVIIKTLFNFFKIYHTPFDAKFYADFKNVYTVFL